MCATCHWEELIDDIDRALETGRVEWATETLEGIKASVEEYGCATSRQMEAVGNIMGAAHLPMTSVMEARGQLGLF